MTSCRLCTNLLSRYSSTLPAAGGAQGLPIPTTQRQTPVSPDERLLKAVVVGAPNAGKSTLVNQLIGQKLLAVSPKVHTTKQRTLGILTAGPNQVVLLDTPGVIPYRYARKLRASKAFITGPRRSTEEADLIVDASNKKTRLKLDRDIVDLLHSYSQSPAALVLNKVDLMRRKHVLLDIVTSLVETPLRNFDQSEGENNRVKFSEVFMVSALSGDGVDKLKDYLFDSTKPSEWEYDPHQLTDQSPELMATEVIREKLFLHLDKEIPYVLKQTTVIWEKMEDGSLKILKNLTCTKRSQMSIVIGPNGRTIQTIISEAANELEAILECPVSLEIHVQLKKHSKQYQ